MTWQPLPAALPAASVAAQARPICQLSPHGLVLSAQQQAQDPPANRHACGRYHVIMPFPQLKTYKLAFSNSLQSSLHSSLATGRSTAYICNSMIMQMSDGT